MSTFTAELAARARARKAELEAAERELAALAKAEGKAQARYKALCDARSDFITDEEHDLSVECARLGDQLRRQQDVVRELDREVAQLESRVQAPQRLQQSTVALQAARAAVAAVVSKREKSSEKVVKLQAQREAELEAAAVGRAWQQEQILSRVEGREPVAGPRPEHAPDQCEAAAALIAGMVDAELRLRDQLDTDIAALRASEAEAEAEVLRAACAVREVEFAEGLASFGPLWSRYRASFIAAYGFEPTEPDFAELGRINEDEVMVEARTVLTIGKVGLLQRAVRRVVEAVAP